jgi:hypothetical protein
MNWWQIFGLLFIGVVLGFILFGSKPCYKCKKKLEAQEQRDAPPKPVV